jgi:hypothetical protein
LTDTAKRTLVLNTLCNEERKESFAQGKKARRTQVQSREKRVLDRGRKQELDKTNAIKERKEIFGQGKRAKTRQVQAQGGDYFNSKNMPILWSLR